MRPKLSQWGRIILHLLLILLVTGCGYQEQKRQDEFVIFLQVEILNKNRINLPTLTEEQRKLFGHYSKQYQLLLDIDHRLKSYLTPIATLLQTIEPIPDINQLIAERVKLKDMLLQLEQNQKKLNAIPDYYQQQVASFNQPEVLNVPFNRIYKRICAEQLEATSSTLTQFIAVLKQGLAVIAFVQDNAEPQALKDGKIEFISQADLRKYQQLNQQLQQLQARYLNTTD